jgi:Na+/melibiose symporter-like transporter
MCVCVDCHFMCYLYVCLCRLSFYVLFWTLSMSDLQVPSAIYEKQVQQLTAQLTAIDNNKDLVRMCFMYYFCF